MSSVLRTVLAVTSLGAAAAFGIAGPAAAAPVAPDEVSRSDVPPIGEVTGATAATEAVLGVAERLQLNPMNGGGFNPLSNTAGADVGGTQVGTGMVTDDLANGMTVKEALAGR
jgi:hypothetical protein